MPLYRMDNSPYQSAVSAMSGASGTASGMTKEQKTTTKAPAKTIGGGIASGVMGAMGGQELASYLFPAKKSVGGGAAALASNLNTWKDAYQAAHAAGWTGAAADALATGSAASEVAATAAASEAATMAAAEAAGTAAASTAGGAASSGATAGSSIGPWGAVAGAVLGLLSYYL
jgi:hypothetical protein